MGKYKVVSLGLGPIGQAMATVALSRPDRIELVGAVDVDPRLLGKDVGELLGSGKNGIKVTNSIQGLYHEADLVLHATSSFLEAARNQLLEICNHSTDAVSTCEELSYPWYNHRAIADELDSVAKKNGVTLLGTGVNPGFVLDALVVSLSGICVRVNRVHGERILDSTKRRLPFQKKIGTGMSVTEFFENVKGGKFGHIGLPESMALVSSALGQNLDRIQQKISPKVAEEDTETEHFGVVPKGQVLGLVQDATGYVKGREAIDYHLEMYAGAEDPHDEIVLNGEPDIKLRIPGGTPGDSATAAIVVNSIPRVVESSPGLMTVRDLRPASSVFAP